MGVASGCSEQEVGVASWSGRKQLLGVVVRRYIDFVSVLFLQQHPYFCSFCFFCI